MRICNGHISFHVKLVIVLLLTLHSNYKEMYVNKRERENFTKIKVKAQSRRKDSV